MGITGPIPKRSDQKVGHPHVAKAQAPKISGRGRARKVKNVPVANPDWHPAAKDWYDSLKKSGQSDYYEASDWAFARLIADEISEYKQTTDKYGNPVRSPMRLTAIMQGMTLLLTTEGDRRRVNIELTEEEAETGVAENVVKDYMAQLRKSAEAA